MVKKKFWELYREYHIGKAELAREAKVEPEVIECLLADKPIARNDAIKVLNVVSRWAGIRYGLEDVQVKLKEVNS